jgi:hypothetical protein
MLWSAINIATAFFVSVRYKQQRQRGMQNHEQHIQEIYTIQTLLFTLVTVNRLKE